MPKKNEKIYKLHASLFKALGHYKRLEILDYLKEEEMQAKEILNVVDISKSGLSQHMSLLIDNGIVESRKEGVKTFYSINEPQVTNTCEKLCDTVVKRLEEAGEIAKEYNNA
ncbi:MAG: ArsR/SmtB family transcription factor [Elusimicrobiota bacterium]